MTSTRAWLSDPPASTLHRGYERLAIEQAVNEERLRRRGSARRAVVRALRDWRPEGRRHVGTRAA